ncbi:MAG: hypothetical protein NWF06_01775 [Candidatus Bathyarchaeota archaeon]|nr:hypothetical protein [Candidatus Bathyarchaeum sp.]
MGLTQRQAMVYLCLVTSGTSTIKTISKGANIARQHIYEIVVSLNELGLVEKALTSPAKFKATPIHVGLSILMEQKNEEYNRLQKQAAILLNNFRTYKIKTVTQEEPQFVLVSGKKAVLYNLIDAMENTQKTMDGVLTWQGFQSAVYYVSKRFKNCLDNGVQLRHIVDVPPEKNQFHKMLNSLVKYSSFKIRYIHPPIPAIMVLYDKEKAVISNSVSTPAETPDLWVTNPHLVTILQDYFETMWANSMSIDQIST